VNADVCLCPALQRNIKRNLVNKSTDRYLTPKSAIRELSAYRHSHPKFLSSGRRVACGTSAEFFFYLLNFESPIPGGHAQVCFPRQRDNSRMLGVLAPTQYSQAHSLAFPMEDFGLEMPLWSLEHICGAKRISVTVSFSCTSLSTTSKSQHRCHNSRTTPLAHDSRQASHVCGCKRS
jgi:hypothetical protein